MISQGEAFRRFRNKECSGLIDAHSDGEQFVVRADEKLTAFVELEMAIYEFTVGFDLVNQLCRCRVGSKRGRIRHETAFHCLSSCSCLPVLPFHRRCKRSVHHLMAAIPGATQQKDKTLFFGLTTGTSNTAVGWFSLRSITAGKFCTGLGAATLLSNTADSNTATGAGALLSNTTGAGNTAVGNFALNTNGAASFNTAVGDLALGFNGTGSGNTAMGVDALCCADAGNNNTLVGSGVMSMVLGSSGNNNMAVGSHALESSTGSNNVALGHDAGHDLTTGDNNIDIGNEVVGVAGEQDSIRIGNQNITDTYIRGISGATAAGGAVVFVNGNGKSRWIWNNYTVQRTWSIIGDYLLDEGIPKVRLIDAHSFCWVLSAAAA